MTIATSQRAAGCAQETSGAVSVTFSERGFQRTPSRTPTAAQATTTQIDSGWSVPSGSGGSSSGPSGSSPSRLNALRGPHGGVRPPRGAPPSCASVARSLDVEDQVVAPGDPVLAHRRQEVGDPALVGDLGVRVDVQPGPQHEGSLRGARVGQPEVVVVGASVAHHDQVDVEGARSVLDLAPLTVEGVLDGERTVEQPRGGQ